METLRNKLTSLQNGLSSRWFSISLRLKNKLKRNNNKKPRAYLVIKHLNDRYLYLLANFFYRADYYVLICHKISKDDYYNKDKAYAYLFTSPEVQHIASINPQKILPDDLLCCDHPVDSSATVRFHKTISLDYNVDFPPRVTHEEVFLPYSMHPNVYRTGQDRSIVKLRRTQKKMGVFFAGNLKEEYACGARLLRHYIPRPRAVESLLRHFGPRVRLCATRQELLRALDEETLTASLVVFDATTERLGREEWFPVLAQSRFFLALPGVVMPMCHNSVEAFALGVVPILSYGQLFSPPLKPGTDCLEYVTEADLFAAVETALTMGERSYAAMRAHAMDFYDHHMAPAAFLDAVFRSRGPHITLHYPVERVSERLPQLPFRPERS